MYFRCVNITFSSDTGQCGLRTPLLIPVHENGKAPEHSHVRKWTPLERSLHYFKYIRILQETGDNKADIIVLYLMPIAKPSARCRFSRLKFPRETKIVLIMSKN